MRKAAKTALLGVAVLVCAVVALKGSVLQVTSGTWAPTANLAQPSAGASAALLQDGRILITGGDAGNGALASADLFNMDGSVSPAAPMNGARSKHVSVTLQDGRVLVAGGTVLGGGATNAAEIYDPIANTWTSLAGGMIEARSGATAALLQDGRAAIAGGQNGNLASSTIEIFDPVAGSFSFAGTLSSPREQHAMAVLADGRVIIIGGSNGAIPVASTDILDPIAGSVAAGPSLATPRSGHSATTLLDGRVLVAGGNQIVTNADGTTTPTDLASVEIFDPAAGTFSAVASTLTTARQGHQAFLLPHNGNVLIVGGTSSGTATASAELYTPWTGAVSGTSPMSTARSQATGSALSNGTPTSINDGLLLVAGGTDASSPAKTLAGTELYGFATVKTDQSDYAPGTIVTITGSGWKPGETVTLSFLESPLIDTHPTLTAIADANGNIFNNQFSPDIHDLKIKFYLTATGSVSQAQTVFTDALPTTTTITSSKNPSNMGDAVTFAATVVLEGTMTPVTVGTVTFAIGGNTNCGGSGAIIIASNVTVDTNGHASAPNTFTSSSGSPFTVRACYNGTGGNTGTQSSNASLSQTVNPIVATTTNVTTSSTPSIYGQSVTFTATVTPNVGSTTPTGSVQFVIDGNFGSAVALSGGTASVSTSTLTVNGGAAHTVAAKYTHTGGFADSSGALSGGQVVNKASTLTAVTSNNNPSFFGQSITFTATVSNTSSGSSATPTGSVQFMDGASALGLPQALNGSGVATFTTTSLTVATHSITAVYSNSDGNFTGSTSSALLQVVKNAQTTTSVSSSKNPSTYGDSVTFTATVAPVDPSAGTPAGTVQFQIDNVNFGSAVAIAACSPSPSACATSGSTSTLTVPSHTITATYTPAVNASFLTSTGSITQTVNKKDATWTTNPASKTYGDSDPNPLTTGSGTNFLAADNVTATYSRTAGETVTGGPYQITATLSPSGVLSNYDITNAGASFTINTRPATWTTNPASKTYGDPDPTPLTTGSGTNFVAADNVTATYSRAAGETVTGGPYQITATLSPSSLLSNYNITNTGASFTINARPATWTTNANSKTYGDGDPTPLTTGTGTNFVAADNVTASYNRAAGESVAGGPYHITATLSPAAVLSNYIITNTGASFTINARPATWTTNANSKTYGDGDPTPLTTGTGTNFVAADNVTASYNRAAGESVAGGPYHITATLSPAAVLSNYIITNTGASFTINARPATWTTNANSKTYGDGDPTPLTTGTGTNFVAADNVTASYNRAAGESVAGGPYHITATLSPAAVLSNYIITNTGASFTINARPATWTTNANSKTYGDGDPTPLTTGTGTNFVAADNVTASYNRAAGESVAGGPYHITATLSPAAVLSNYIITNTGASFTINARPATWTTNANSKTYGDGDPTPLTTGTGTNFVAADNVTASYNRAAGESVAGGPYHITATLSPAAVLSNYIITNTGASFTINARPATWTTNANSKTYGDGDPTPLTTGTGTNFVAADNVTASYNRAAGESVAGGPYHITATLSPAAVLSNYIITNTGASFTINARPATWTTNANSKTYGDGDPTPLTTGTGTNFVAADNVTASYNRAAGESVAGGPYHITATLSPAAVLSNYIITNTGASFTINARPATWTTNANSKTYGDGDPTPLTTGTGTNFVAADNVTASYNRAAGESVAGGPYHITATLSPAAVLSNYIITNTGASFTINARPATWTTNANSKTYGDGDPTPLTTGTGTNFVAADNVTASYNRAAGESVAGGPYHITATLSPAAVLSNYIITNTGADFTVNARPATWTTNPNSKTYGDTDPSPLTIGSGTNFLAADGVSATYSRVAGETVGGNPYHITATLSSTVPNALSNYIITNTGASFTIDARPATWTTNATSKTYGDGDPNPLTTGAGTNFVPADGVTATYSRVAGETVGGSPYHVTATLSSTVPYALNNYVVTNAGADFAINARPATWTTNPNSKTYGDTDPSPLTSGSGTNFLATDGVTATYSRASGETVTGGPYHITGTLSSTVPNALNNYIITNNGASFTIGSRPVTWTTNPASKTYGNPDPSPLTTGSGTNFLAADGVSATYSRALGETVLGGPYHITATLAPSAVLSNYAITNAGASFTISPANTMTSVSTWTPNPSVYDQAITLSALVSTSASATVNEGAIAFTADTAMTPLCTTGPVLGGAASCTTGSLTLAVGGHTIIATYVPGPDFFGSGSASVPQTVNPRHTSVAITSTEVSNFMTGSVPINTLVHLQVTVTDDDTNGTPITPTGTFSITSLIASDTFSPTDGSGNGLCTLSGSGASASCSLTVTPVEADQHILTANYPGDSVHLASTQMADMMVTAPLVSQKVCLSAPFNGQAIPAGSTVWFNAVFQTTGQKITTLTHLTFYNQTIQVGTGTPMPVPDGVITFDPTATLASTTFDAVNNRWNTTLPTYNLAGKNWLSGMPVRFPFGLAASTAPVTWCGQFASDSSTIALGWQWAAAVYTNFVSFDPNNPSDLSGVGVKSVDDNKADVNYKNSDHAGTPEKYLQFVIGGARGGGGGNYTGGYSGSGNLK